MDNKTKSYGCLLPYEIESKKQERQQGRCRTEFWEIFFRERNFSLKYRAIRPLAVFGTRREAALHGEGFAWVSDLGSFLKLREVGVSPYLGFIPSLSTLSMFELNEAVRGRLIGPKTWDQIVGKFCRNFLQSVTVGAVIGC